MYYSNLYKYKRAETQTVDNLAAYITKLATRVNLNMPRRQKENLAKEHFIQEIRLEIKRYVLLSSPKIF